MEHESKTEKAPLLDHSVNEETMLQKSSIVRIYFSVLLVAFTGFAQLFVAGMSTYNLQQYAYERFRKIDFPNVVFNATNDGGNPLCGTNISTNSTEYKMEAQVQKSVAEWTLYNSISSGIPTIFSSVIVSSLSDRYGRKLLLPIPLVGAFVTILLVALSMYLEWNVYVITALLALSSMSGSWITTIALSFAYAADVTSGKSRTFMITVVEIVCVSGFLVSVFASGFLINNYGFIVPQFTSAAITLLSMIIIVTCVPESLPENKKQKKEIFQQIKSAMEFYTKKYLYEKSTDSLRKKYIICITAFSLVNLGTIGRTTVEILYQLGPPICWDSIEVSNWGTCRTLVQQVVAIIGIKLFQVCLSDEKIAAMGSVSTIGYFIMEGLSKTTFQLYIGSLFASIAMFENIFVMVSSIISNAIYGATVDINRSFVFYVLAGTNGLALLLIIYLCFDPSPDTDDDVERTINISENEERTK